jgi:hypothetical protein
MKMHEPVKKKSSIRVRSIALPAFCLAILFACANPEFFVQVFGQSSPPASDLKITASIENGQAISPDDKIELTLSRELKKSEGRLAILIARTDVSSLFTPLKQTLTYNRKILPLPLGENPLTVYLVSPADGWQEIASFTLRVAKEATKEQTAISPKAPDNKVVQSPVESPTTENQTATATTGTQTEAAAGNSETARPAAQNDAAGAPAQSEPAKKKGGFDKLAFIPSITIGMKSQAAESHFPDATRPLRPLFSDATLQGSFKTEATRGLFTSQTQFDLAGSSFQQEALQFGRLGNQAPQVDMASYLMQFQVGKAKFIAGHTAYGANRHLINSFSSRGITMTLPLSANFDFSLAAMNGTSIVGFDNFFFRARQTQTSIAQQHPRRRVLRQTARWRATGSQRP